MSVETRYSEPLLTSCGDVRVEKKNGFGEGVPPPLRLLAQRRWAKTTLLGRGAVDDKSNLAARFCHYIERRIPIIDWLPKYDYKSKLRGDIIGGIIIGLILICQTMAHAAIATTSTVQGPYCALVPALVYACFGSSPHASISSGAVAAVMIAEQLDMFGTKEVRTRVATMYALLVGTIVSIAGITKFTFLVRFLSRPVLSGFITGAAFIIASTQSKQLTGLDHELAGLSGFIPIVTGTIKNLKSANWIAIAIGISVMGFLEVMKKVNMKYKKSTAPLGYSLKLLADFKELVAVILTGTIVIMTRAPDWSGNRQEEGLIVNVVGPVPQGLPPFREPWLDLPEGLTIKKMIPGAILISITTYITTFASSKRVALQQGYPIRAGQEGLALGLAGIVGSFFGCFPVSGSLSRAALLPAVGISSQIGGLVATCVVASGLIFCSSLIYWIPKCTLSGIIILSCYNLQDFAYFTWLVKTSHVFPRAKQTAKKVFDSSKERLFVASPTFRRFSNPAPNQVKTLWEDLDSSNSLPGSVQTPQSSPGGRPGDLYQVNEYKSSSFKSPDETSDKSDVLATGLLQPAPPLSSQGSLDPVHFAHLKKNSLKPTSSEILPGVSQTLSGSQTLLPPMGDLSGGISFATLQLTEKFAADPEKEKEPDFDRQSRTSDLVNTQTTNRTLRHVLGVNETAVLGFSRDIVVWLVAFITTLWHGVLVGVSASCILSLLVLLYTIVFPPVFQLGKVENHGSLHDMKRSDAQGIPVSQFDEVIIFEWGASMHFANVEYMKEEAERLLAKEKRSICVIILSFVRVNTLDSTALYVMEELFQVWRDSRQYKILAADAKGEVLEILTEHMAKYFAQPKMLLTIEECLFQARYIIEDEKKASLTAM